MQRILLVDHEVSHLNKLVDFFSTYNAEIVTCIESQAAEALLEHYYFDLFISDISISSYGGLEGLRLIRHVANHFPKTKIVALPDNITKEKNDLFIQAGAHIVSEKPLSRLAIFDEILHKKSILNSNTVHHITSLEELLTSQHIRSTLQPIVDIRRKNNLYSIFGYECLARAASNIPILNPEILFLYAAKKDSLFETDMLCINAALAVAQTLDKNANLFINVQPRSMTNENFVENICAMVKNSGFSNENIYFELTEQQTILNLKALQVSTRKLRQHGFKVGLDDFGIGYSNIYLLQEIEPDFVKLAGSFCKNIEKLSSKQTIVGYIAKMCQELNIPIIMERVENKSELVKAQELGIGFAQGHYFGCPDKQ